MTPTREQIVAALKLILSLVIERKAESLPFMFRGLLASLSPESIEAMLTDNLTEADWIQIEALLH